MGLDIFVIAPFFLAESPLAADFPALHEVSCLLPHFFLSWFSRHFFLLLRNVERG